MMSLQYQNLYEINKPSGKLDTYCRLEGLDPAYLRSEGRIEAQLLSRGKNIVRNVLGRMFTHTTEQKEERGGKSSTREEESSERGEILQRSS